MSYYYGRRRRSTGGRPSRQAPPTPTFVSVEDLADALVATHDSIRALTGSELTAQQSDRWSRRSAVTLYDGRNRIPNIEAGKVVIVDTQTWGWRINVSLTMEPTPNMIRQGPIPTGADRISEVGGFCIYQTPASMHHAASYQASKGRRDMALALFELAIKLKCRPLTKDQVKATILPMYKRFRGCAALALQGATDGECDAGMIGAIKSANTLIKLTINKEQTS